MVNHGETPEQPPAANGRSRYCEPRRIWATDSVGFLVPEVRHAVD
jgi:hypothetical protein